MIEDTLKSYFDELIRKLAKNQTVELNNYYLAEQEHLQEVKRANEYSQKIHFPRDDGDNVNKENEKLLSSYQLENEKLYLRNKGKIFSPPQKLKLILS